MQSEQLIELRNTNYYMIVNKAIGHAMYLDAKSETPQKQVVGLRQPDQLDLSYVWMIVEVEPYKYPNMFEIVHTVSTLVMTSEKNQMRLNMGKWKSNQLFFFQRHDPKNFPNEFWIKQEKDSNKYLMYYDGLKCQENNDPSRKQAIWELILVNHNDVINRSCYIEYAYSNMVLDVPRASNKLGEPICQYPCNNRFNQRWNLRKVGDLYQIQNLKTSLFLDIKKESTKPGANVIQWKETGKANQLWNILYQGKGIYLIQSALDENLYLSVRDNSFKQCAEIVTTDDDAECFWRIIGYVPE